MSSCLITHICVGPVKLSKAKKLRKKAVLQAKTIIDYVGKWAATESTADAPKLPRIPSVMKRYGSDDLDDWRCVLGVDPEKAIDELFELWHGDATPGDVNTREYLPWPGAAKRQILVAGDNTWGDPPDGEGYRICQQSSLLGLFDLYRIR